MTDVTETAQVMKQKQTITQQADGSQSILIVEDDTLVGMGLKTQLTKLGHEVIGQAATAEEAKKMFAAEKPDVVLLDIRLDGSDGIDLAKQLMAERSVPMVIISAFSDPELIERAGHAGAFGYLIKPVSVEALRAGIEMAVRRFADTEVLRLEKGILQQTLETRRLVDRAKAILIKRAGLSEDEAHRRLQHESQKRRTALSEIARKIIESEEIIGPPTKAEPAAEKPTAEE